ncbi:MAG: amidohydrolase [Bacillota bacterium]|nr:amidohydrolase [Bacillota bacterium]
MNQQMLVHMHVGEKIEKNNKKKRYRKNLSNINLWVYSKAVFMVAWERVMNMGEIDLVVYDGTVLTMDDNNTICNWIAVSQGKIIDLGDGEGYKKYLDYANEVLDLDGKTVLPGFYDSHVHLVQTGLNMLDVNLSNVKSINELLVLIEKKAQNMPPGKLIRGIGFDELRLEEQRMPTRYELDECAPNNPVWINRVEYHTSVVNSLALHQLSLPYNLEGIARDERNLPTGLLTGKAGALVRNQIFNTISDQTRLKAVNKALNKAVENGITTLNAMEGGFTFHDKDAEMIFNNKEVFPIDVVLFYQTVNIEKILNKNLSRIGGCIFLDGSFGSRTAALAEAYSDDSSTSGVLFFSQEDLNEFVLNAHTSHLQVTVHAIGTRAIEQILNAYEYAQSIYPREDHRHRIEHFELPLEEHIDRAARLGLILSMQPAYEYFWGNKNGMYETRLGPERSRRTNPLKKILERRITVVGGSDSDVTPMNPILGIHTAVNHPKVEYSVDVMQALKFYTINGAKAVFEEKQKGSIEVGKLGDLVVLDQNPLKVNKAHIKDIKVMATIKEGNILFMR